METASLGSQGKQLLRKITCPNCWLRFSSSDILFVAKHPDLVGDAIVGSNEFLRFEPERFDVHGNAVDPKGFSTSELACPKCHLQIPELMLEIPPFFISFVGAPASGKSYFLATMSWELRKLMPKMGLTFTDADPSANSHIQEYEHTLFLSADPDTPTEIRKTQTDDPKLHKQVLLDGAAVHVPIPLQFLLRPTATSKHSQKAQEIGRVIVMYDNAGEHFLPKILDSTSQVVQHLARSKLIFMLFDPTQDSRFRNHCKINESKTIYNSNTATEPFLIRQETLLREMAVRIRRYMQISEGKRLHKPLIILVAKCDIWGDAVGISIDREPYINSDNELVIDMPAVEHKSEQLRTLFNEICPELVATAENLTSTVRFIPVSSLGTQPELLQKQDRQFYGIKPSQIKPKWVTVPLVYSLFKWLSALNGKSEQVHEE